LAFKDRIEKYRAALTVCLALMGIGAMVLYTYCDTSCSSLQGDIFGIDLKYIGPAFMIVVAILTSLRQLDYSRMLLAAGIGGEIYLFAFQVREDIFCEYCLAFAATVVLAFALHYKRPERTEGAAKQLIYLLGSCDIPLLGMKDIPLAVFIVVGYVAIVFMFSGGVIPLYGA